MKLNRWQNAKRGMLFGLLYRITGTLLPFLVQMVVIRKLGIEYIGLRGLFSSVLTVFSLAELGFGSAIVFFMYKPIAEDNIEDLSALLNFYKRTYRIIGLVILVLGLMILPWLPHLVKGSYPTDINIYYVFTLFLAQTVLSYWMFAYKASLLNAYQRTDIINMIGTVVLVLTSFAQIALLYLTGSFYAYLIASVVFTFVNNVLISVTVNKLYPRIKTKGNVNSDILRDIRVKVSGLLVGKLCGISRNAFDVIFVSMFIGLSYAGMYSNYYNVMVAVTSFTTIITTSLLAGVGNSIVLESKEKNYRDMMVINKIYLVIGGCMTACMLCLYQPFMTLWMGRDYLFPNEIIVLFSLYFYIQKMGDVRAVYSDAAGLFWENRWRNITEAVANLILNYVFVIKFGVVGIVLATIFTLFIFGFLGSTQVIFRHYFNFGKKEYLLSEMKYLTIALLVCSITYLVCSFITIDSMLFLFVVRLIVCFTIAPALYWIILNRGKDYREVQAFLMHMIRGDRV